MRDVLVFFFVSFLICLRCRSIAFRIRLLYFILQSQCVLACTAQRNERMFHVEFMYCVLKRTNKRRRSYSVRSTHGHASRNSTPMHNGYTHTHTQYTVHGAQSDIAGIKRNYFFFFKFILSYLALRLARMAGSKHSIKRIIVH